MKFYTTTKGSVALVTVILITGLLLAIGITVIMTSADVAVSIKDSSSATRVDEMVRTCLEESMFRIKRNKTFTGQFTFAENGGTCTVDVQNDVVELSYKNISIVASVHEFQKTGVYTVDISLNPFEIVD